MKSINNTFLCILYYKYGIMKNKQKHHRLLYNSFYGQLSNKQKIILETALKDDLSLQKEKQKLLKIESDLKKLKYQPDKNFEKGIMQRVKGQVMNDAIVITKPVFNAMVFSGIAAIILVLFSIYQQDGSLTFDILTGVSGYSPALGLFSIF